MRPRAGKRIFILLAALLLTPFIAAQGQEVRPPPGHRERVLLEPYGYVDEDAKWADTRISVCWESAEDRFQVEKKLVEKALADSNSSFVENSSLRFVGWKTCKSGSDGIAITISDENPWSEVGPQIEGFPRKLRRTRMLLNFEFSKWPCTDKNHCIVAIARHEFMHAIGVLHEHLRPDTPKECMDLYAGRPDNVGKKPAKVSAYDPDSIMNYCNNIYNVQRAPDLSAIDKVVIGFLYPPSPR